MKIFKQSIMRVMAVIALLTGCYIGIRAVELGLDLTAAGILVAAFLVPAFGGKAYQAKIEKDKLEQK